MKHNHIFIQCASYRDTELKPTIKSAIDNADNPANVSFGICLQGELSEIKRDLPSKYIKQCRMVFIHHKISKGIGYARQKAQMMFEEEEYSLQIDSHMRFMPRWDTMCINMLKKCPSKKPLLTAYLTDYAIDEEPGCWRLGIEDFDEDGNIIVTGVDVIKNETKPSLGILVSGHFVFAKSELFKEVPVDPNMPFLYEESLFAPRAWTSGWDIYYPHKAPLQHKWNRSYRNLNWNDRDTTEEEQYGKRLYRQLVGIEPGFHNFGVYGMGNTRSLEDYELFSGINFKDQFVTEDAQLGLPAKNIAVLRRP